MFTFYHAQSRPAGLTGTVGGAIDLAAPYVGYLSELLPHVDAPPSQTSDTFYQYRKLYIRNEGEVLTSDTRLWIEAAAHPDQIEIAVEASANQTATSPTTEPSGIISWRSPTTYLSGITLGDLAPTASVGVWIRQILTDISVSDPYSSLRLKVGGLTR